MKKLGKLICIPLCIILFTSQSSGQSLDNLKAINQTWEKFYKAFESLDYKLLQDIHAKELVRVSGGKRIVNYDTCMDNYKKSFERTQKKGTSNTISLRFFERVNNGSMARERGIYKLTRVESTGETKSYYGQFHVVLIKKDNIWKIVMDYDSNEGNTIGEEAYLRAHAIDAFDKFIQKQ